MILSETRARPAFLLACLFGAAGCDTSPGIGLPGGVSFLQQDSAGVVVATTLGARARSPSGWVVDAEPEYQLGELDGDEPYLFTTIAGARQLADGRVAVLDRSTCELRFFDPDGVFLEGVGGTGEGPGEFRRRCELVSSLDPDSLFGWDGSSLSVFDDRGRFIRRHLLPWPGRRVASVAGVADGLAVVTQEQMYWPRLGGPSHPLQPVHYAMLEPETGRLVWEKIGLPSQRVYAVPGATLPIPFDIRPSVAMARDGLYMTFGEDQGPEIRQYGAGGHLSRVIRLAEPLGGAPTREDIRSLVEFELAPHDVDSAQVRIYREARGEHGNCRCPRSSPSSRGSWSTTRAGCGRNCTGTRSTRPCAGWCSIRKARALEAWTCRRIWTCTRSAGTSCWGYGRMSSEWITCGATGSLGEGDGEASYKSLPSQSGSPGDQLHVSGSRRVYWSVAVVNAATAEALP